VPGVALAGDFIVGFPTETDDEYAMTRSLVEKVRYKNCFIFKYSPRPGTVAIKRFEDDVPDEVKRWRNNDLLRVQNRVSIDLNQELLGKTVEILCDGPSGWGDEKRDPESVVTGVGVKKEASCGEANGVELGNLLAAGMKKRERPAGKDEGPDNERAIDRHGNAYVKPMAGRTEPGWVQMTGRTSHDQIVVFQGPEELAGKLLDVHVREAHGMTIFGDYVQAEVAVTAG